MAQAGADYAADATATAAVSSPAFYRWSSDSLRDQVQGMLDNPATDFGWLMIGGSNNSKRFFSRENGNVSNRPVLHVVYTP